MRILIPLLCILPLAAAQDATDAPAAKPRAEAIVKDGKLTDPIWHLTYEARGLERGLATPKQGMLFEGRAAGNVQIELMVIEDASKRDGAKWRAWLKDIFTKAKRPMKDVEESAEGLPTLVFTESKLDIFTEHHGYAFYARGYQGFIVHAYVADKTDKSGERIAECLKGLKLADKQGPTFLAFRFAQQNAMAIDDPRILLAAGQAYAHQEQMKNLALSAQVLAQARKAMKEGTYTPIQTWQLYETGGYANLAKEPRDTKAAIEWLTMAEKAAAKLPEEQRQQTAALSAYNLACAYSLAGEVEKGFEALHRSFKDSMPVDAGHLEKDKDLDNLKKDQARWDKFWKECVAGR